MVCQPIILCPTYINGIVKVICKMYHVTARGPVVFKPGAAYTNILVPSGSLLNSSDTPELSLIH